MDELRNMHRAKQQRKNYSQEKYSVDSKDRLMKIVKTKMTTCFIGPLSDFEEAYGDIWGHNIPPEERTEEQKKEFEIWNAVREKILNRGHHQIRAIENEVEQYSIKWNRYKYDLDMRRQ